MYCSQWLVKTANGWFYAIETSEIFFHFFFVYVFFQNFIFSLSWHYCTRSGIIILFCYVPNLVYCPSATMNLMLHSLTVPFFNFSLLKFLRKYCKTLVLCSLLQQPFIISFIFWHQCYNLSLPNMINVYVFFYTSASQDLCPWLDVICVHSYYSQAQKWRNDDQLSSNLGLSVVQSLPKPLHC